MSDSTADNDRVNRRASTITAWLRVAARGALATALTAAVASGAADSARGSTPPSAIRGNPLAFLTDVKEQLTPRSGGVIAAYVRARTRCSLSFARPGGSRSGPFYGTARAREVATWRWKVASRVGAGSWTATIRCGRVKLRTTLLVGGSATSGAVVGRHSMRFLVARAAPAPQLVMPVEPHGGRGGYPDGRAVCRWTDSSSGLCSGDNWGYRQGGRWALVSGRGFPYRSSADYAAWLLGLTRTDFGFFVTQGAAVDWLTNAGRAGLTVASSPKVGDIAWWGKEAVGGSGYVGVVTAVNAANGAVTVADYNADGRGTYTPTTLVRRADAYLEPPGVGDGPSGIGAPASSTRPPGGVPGREDILAAEPNGFGGTRYVVGYNDGSGLRFRWVASNVTRAPYTTLMAVGDVNGDGKADIVATEPACGPGHVDYLVGLSNGNGTFSWRHTDLNCVPSPMYIGLGDVLGNGRQDVIAEEAIGAGQVQFVVYDNDGTGLSWTRAVTNLTNLPHPADVAVGPVTGSGRADIVAAEPGGQFMVGLSKGDGNFTWNPANLTTGLPVEHLALGDALGNGRQDIVVGEPSPSGGTQYVVAQNNGTGLSYTWAPTATGASPAIEIALADMNGDGKADLIAATPQASCFGGSSYAVGLSNGEGTFGIKSTNLRCNVAPIAIGVGKVLG